MKLKISQKNPDFKAVIQYYMPEICDLIDN